jgi:lysophospholipase L1-like esterase
MKSFIKYSSIVITVMILLLGSLRLHPYYRLAKSQDLISDSVAYTTNDTLKIAFIGDSWAAYHHDYDKELKIIFSQKGLPAHVFSVGNVGAKSHEIYERMFSTTKPVLMERPNYCVISAGINDAVAKLGKEYYVHHYMLILQQLLKLGIRPVVLEMPEVNYRAVADREPWTMRIRHILSSLLTGSELYGFDSYKTALIQAIKKTDMQSSIIYISADSWNAAGYQDKRGLYLSDEIHLNAKGYAVLDSCIASEILKDIREKQLN